ncbi:MAG: spermidine/putrescine ABC transporter substrate-binding protein [Micrococcales bacterium]|nr:spermidine/putrescine ABC transporter substrate-binding protein [Micrococcales bacterium]
MTDSDPIRVLLPAGAQYRLTRRAVLSAALGLGATAALAACSSGSGGSGSGGTLNIYTWADYDDPATLKTFTKKSGPKITVDSYGSNPEMIAKLSAAKGTTGYDICVPTHSAIPQMVKNKLLAPLDLSRIPNFANLDASVTDTKWDPGNKFSVCKNWGTSGYAYDTTKISRQLTSWADFWDVLQNEASGSVSLLEDQSEIAMAYFFANGKNPNTQKQSDIAAYRDFVLTKVAQHVTKFSSSLATQIANSEQMLVHAWNGDVRQGKLASKQPERYRWVYPSEGANLWQDNWAIVQGAPNPDAAYRFIDYVLQPAVSLQELQFIGYNTGVKGIKEKAVAAGVELPELVFIDDAIMTKLVYSEQTTMDQRIIDIYNELTAKAGA